MENRNQSERRSEEPKREIEKDFLENLNSKSVFEKILVVTRDIQTFTKEEINTIMSSINTKKARDEADIYLGSYNAILLYGKILLGIRNGYRAEAVRLTSLINILQSYENVSKVLEESFKDGLISAKDNKPFILSLQYGSIKIDKSGKASLDIEGEGNLHTMLKDQSKAVKAKLSFMKSFVETLSDFALSDHGFSMYALLPYYLENILDFPDAIPEQNDKSKEKFFKYKLTKLKDHGKTVTDEELKFAFYPDYNEVKRDKDGDKAALKTLKDSFKLWNLTKLTEKKTS